MRLVLVFFLFVSCSKAKDEQPLSRDINLYPISELEQLPTDPDETLINGRIADPKDFPASVYSEQDGSRCTATIVGPRLLFIAAHCVDHGAKANFRIQGESYTSVCTHSKDYAGNPTADYALCKVDRVVTGIKYEVVNTSESVPSVGDEILLTGFGCINPGGGGGNDGKYRIGEAKVTRTPVGTDNDIHTSGPAALCYGDSGGPAFYYLDKAKTKRVQISINSRGDIRRNSYLSAVATAQGKRFIQAYLEREGLEMCGVTPNTPNCRNSSEGPHPEPLNPCLEAHAKVGLCLKGDLLEYRSCYKALSKVFSCLDAAVLNFLKGA